MDYTKQSTQSLKREAKQLAEAIGRVRRSYAEMGLGLTRTKEERAQLGEMKAELEGRGVFSIYG